MGRGGVLGGLALVYKQLFTREDRFNAHKMLGFACLAHFIFRFAGAGAADMYFDSSPTTVLCIAMHALLSVSSMIFRIPAQRIKEGSRIWPEFRLHSIVFACRSLACMTVVWAEKR